MFLVPVGDSQYLIGVVTVLTRSVNLQFYPEISLRITVEYRFRLISVVMDRTVSVNFLMIAVRAVIIAVKMISIVLM